MTFSESKLVLAMCLQKVPPPFLKHFEGKVPSSIHVKHSLGMSWIVQMEETEEGFILSKGYVELVRDLGLEFGDFVVFWMVEKRTFRIVVYGRDLCEKAVPPRRTGNLRKQYSDCFP